MHQFRNHTITKNPHFVPCVEIDKIHNADHGFVRVITVTVRFVKKGLEEKKNQEYGKQVITVKSCHFVKCNL